MNTTINKRVLFQLIASFLSEGIPSVNLLVPSTKLMIEPSFFFLLFICRPPIKFVLLTYSRNLVVLVNVNYWLLNVNQIMHYFSTMLTHKSHVLMLDRDSLLKIFNNFCN